MGLKRLVAALAVLMVISGPAAAERFQFVAIGDTAYNLPKDEETYAALITRINQAKPVFTIHIGDSWGAEPCTEANHNKVLGVFAKYDHPVVYTPGDNEWTDCRKAEVLEAYHRYEAGKATPEDLGRLLPLRSFEAGWRSAGYDDPLASLATIRRLFFGKAESLGARTMPLTRQTDITPTAPTPENVRWSRGGVMFATLSVPGSANGVTFNDDARLKEATARIRADIDWVRATFAEARARDAPAVVLALQAAMFDEVRGGDFTGKAVRGGTFGPYYWIVFAIRDEAARYGKPVLLIHGDDHQFIVDRPFVVSQGESKPPLYSNITRLQVYGAPELKAVQVSVDTEVPWVFSFQPLYN